jgi:hypothetical protein
MSLQSKLALVIDAIGTDVKSLFTRVNDLEAGGGTQGPRGARIFASNLAGQAPDSADYPSAISGDTVLDADTGKVWVLEI